jgi:hypothetical protein
MAPAAFSDSVADVAAHLPVIGSKPSTISASVLHGPRDLRLVRLLHSCDPWLALL